MSFETKIRRTGAAKEKQKDMKEVDITYLSDQPNLGVSACARDSIGSK